MFSFPLFVSGELSVSPSKLEAFPEMSQAEFSCSVCVLFA